MERSLRDQIAWRVSMAMVWDNNVPDNVIEQRALQVADAVLEDIRKHC